MAKEESHIPAHIKKQLEEVAEQIIRLKRTLHIGTASLTPLNYGEEMAKFFSSKNYNPMYTYNKKDLPNITRTINEFKKQIDALEIPDELKEHFLDFLDDQNTLFLTKKSIGSQDFSEYAHKLFDWGSDRLDLLLSNTPKVEFTMHIKHKMQDAEKIKERFEKALSRYNISGFEVKIDTFSPHIINVGQHTINIGSEIRRFECNVDRLVVHEIESHVLQAQNSKSSNTPLVEFSKYGNQNLYGEGLAVYNEVTTRKITPSAFEMYYSRIKAVRLLHKSFREIFDTLCETLTPQRAFVMTYRVKRGLSDTSHPGGFPKDAAYLLGFHEIENLMTEKFPKKLLYATRSPILSRLLSKYGLLDTENVLTPKFQR